MVDRRLGEGTPFRNRFRLPLTLFPILAGVGTAIPLWDSQGEPEFFEAGAHVIALGGIGLAIQGRFFRLKQHVSGAISDVYAIVNVVTVLISIGLGWPTRSGRSPMATRRRLTSRSWPGRSPQSWRRSR